MSDAVVPQQTNEDWETIFNQLDEDWATRDQVSVVLREAKVAFTSQFTESDAFKFVHMCDKFATFLERKISLDDSEQQSVVETIQIVCAVHENAVNNPALKPEERAAHYLASSCLIHICQAALDGPMQPDYRLEVFNLAYRAEISLQRAEEALGFAKCLAFADMLDDPGATSVGPPPTPAIFRLTKSSDIADIRLSARPMSNKFKERALMMLNVPSQGARLERAHSMPALFQTMPDSQTDRTLSRGDGLSAVQEETEA